MVVTIGGMVRCVVTLEVKIAAVVEGEIVVITLVVVKDAEIVMLAQKAYHKRITACKLLTYHCMQRIPPH